MVSPPPSYDGASVGSVSGRAGQSVNWCFTLNNYTDEDQMFLNRLGWSLDTKYLVYGREVGAAGTPHLQGFIVFQTRKRFQSVRALLPQCHIELGRGSAYQAAGYCKKDGDFSEFGVPPMQPGRAGGAATSTKWQITLSAAKDCRLDDIPAEMMIKHYSTIKRIGKDFMKKPDPLNTVCGLWVYGATGTGKSHSVINQHPGRFIKPLNKWWDGYQNEPVVHLDEIDDSHASWIAPYLKKWGDKWPFDAEVKGGALCLRPNLIVVTSNYKIEEMGFKPNDLAAILRRFRQVEKFRDQDLIIQ